MSDQLTLPPVLPASSVTVRVLHLEPHGFYDVFVQRWRDLERECAAPNTFLSPDFVLPYINNHPPQFPLVLLAGEDSATGRLLGLGIFETVRASKTLPLPHLVSYRGKHLYRDGILVAAGREEEFFRGLLTFMCTKQDSWYGIEFRKLMVEENWAKRLRNVAIEYGCSFRLTARHVSPMVCLHDLKGEQLETLWSSSRRKSVRRNRNRLEKYGPVGFRLVTHPRDVSGALRHFLKLEHEGWKGEHGTSLLSCPHDSAFIRELVEKYAAQDDVLISQLTVGDEIAACAVNLRSGNKVYAFKIGWNEKFAEASPGLLHEIELIRALQEYDPTLQYADSCAQADSYIGNVWPDRLVVGEGLLSITTLARGTGKLISQLRTWKHWASERMKSAENEETK